MASRRTLREGSMGLGLGMVEGRHLRAKAAGSSGRRDGGGAASAGWGCQAGCSMCRLLSVREPARRQAGTRATCLVGAQVVAGALAVVHVGELGYDKSAILPGRVGSGRAAGGRRAGAATA